MGGEGYTLGVDADGDLGFYNSGAATASVTFDDSGNVGIGTTTAGRRLTVKSNISATVANFESTSSVSGLVSFSDSNTTNDETVRVGAAGDNLVLQAGGAERMRITSAGSVGIGCSPNQLLELRNTSGDFLAEATIRGSTSAGAPKAEIAFKRESSGDDTSIVFFGLPIMEP